MLLKQKEAVDASTAHPCELVEIFVDRRHRGCILSAPEAAKGESHMITYDDSIVIEAPLPEAFAYVNELRTMPDWLTGLVEVRNVIGTGVGQQCDWTFKMIGVQLRGAAVVVDCVPNEWCTHQSIGMLSSEWTNIVEAHEDGTKLTVKVEYTLPGAVLGKLAEHLTVRRMKRDLRSSLLNVKDMLEG